MTPTKLTFVGFWHKYFGAEPRQMGNCIRKQREKELAKRALKRDELVRFFLGGDDHGHYATSDGKTGGVPAVTDSDGGGGCGSCGRAIAQEAPSAGTTTLEALTEVPTETQQVTGSASAAAVKLGSATFTTAAAAAMAQEEAAEKAVAEDPGPGWRLTDKRREAALYAMENDGIDRLHDNSELQLEQRRERQRRDERLLAIVGCLTGGGGGVGGVGGCSGGGLGMWDDGDGRRAGTPTAFANAYNYHGGQGSSSHAAVSYHGSRHVSFGGLDYNKPGGYRK